MKIALITDGIYPYAMGGMQKHSFYLAKYFAQNKVFVVLYHISINKEFDIHKLEFFTDEEKKFIRPFVIDFPTFPPLPGHYLKESYQHSINVFNVLKNNLDEVSFIYAKGFSGWKLLEEKKKGKKFPPIGVNFHGYEMFQKTASIRQKFESWLLRSPILFNVRNADYLFSYGGKITPLISNLIPNSANKIIEIPTGIDANWLNHFIQKSQKKKKLLFIGRYERRKGIEELTAVLKEMINEFDFEFYFIGPIPNEKKIVSEKIIYHGKISNQEEIKKVVKSCDMLICPSYSEGMPNVIMEAMASGLAVLATDVGAVRELVSDKTGWLMENAEKSKIRQALITAIKCSDEDLMQKKLNACNHIQQNFLWENIIKDTIQKINMKCEM